MTDRQFVRKKMRWLNAMCRDSDLSSMSFRVAYLIGDYLGSITQVAWPSHARMASELKVATKTIQRSTRELEQLGWLDVRRARGRETSNRYRLRWPEDPTKADKSGP